MKFSRAEVDALRVIANLETCAFCISPRVKRELDRVRIDKESYQYREGDGAFSVVVDFYPGRRTSAERMNEIKAPSEDRH